MKWLIAFPILMLTTGCGNSDRFGEIADRIVTEQTRQNAEVTRQTGQIAEASKQLVAADAQARKELVEANEHLQSEVGQERRIVDQQRSALETERQQIAAQRQRAPVIADAISGTGLLIAMVLPLAVAVYLLRYLATSPEPAR